MVPQSLRAFGFGVLLVSLIAPGVYGALSGTVVAAPGDTVTPGLTSATAGTLLATISAPFTTVTGTMSGTVISAVYKEAGGTLDFYYQVVTSSSATNCGSSGKTACDSVARLTGLTFAGFATALGYRTDGANTALLGASDPFTNGTVPPVSGDRESVGTAVGFSFYPPDSAKIHPGSTSYVLVISTDATAFTAGSATVVGGGGATVATFRPATPAAAIKSAAGAAR